MMGCSVIIDGINMFFFRKVYDVFFWVCLDCVVIFVEFIDYLI